MQQNEYTENLFRSVDTIVAERIKNLSYDYTQLMEITDDNNANAGMYKVKLNSNTDVVAYADNPSYQAGDQVYVLNTGDGDRRFILGTFLKNSTGRIDRSNSDLIKLRNDVDKLLFSSEDLTASLAILPGQIESKIKSLDEKFSSELTQTAQKFEGKFKDTEKQLESNFSITAEMLRSEFSDEANGLYSRFIQTAGMFQTEVIDDFNKRWSRITQTADEIKSEVADDMNGLYSVIDQTAGEIRSEVHDSINGLSSLIDQTAGEIRLEVADSLNGYHSQLQILSNQISSRVEDIEGNYSLIKQTADSITSRVESMSGNFSEIKQTADMISSRVQDMEGNYSQILQTTYQIQSEVHDTNGNYSQIKQTVDSISLSVTDAADGSGSTINLTKDGITASAADISFAGLVHFKDIDGTKDETIIDGSVIKSGTLKVNDHNNKGGGISWGYGEDGGGTTTYGTLIYGWQGTNSENESLDDILDDARTDDEIDVTNKLNTSILLTNAGIRIATKNEVPYAQIGLWSGNISISNYLENKHTDGNIAIKAGSGGINLTAVGGSIISDPMVTASDQNKKNSISYKMEKYENFYKLIKPVYYKLNEGTSNRYHIGYIYQDIESALLKSGLTSQDFAGVVKTHQNTGELFCGLRYEEFIALNTHMIQKTRKELEEKDNKIQQLENRIDELEQKLNLLLETLS